MLFLADGMLGRLARWMRLLGEDVFYRKDADDDDLIRLAVEERRTLLTSDLELYRRTRIRSIETYLIEGKTETEKLAEVAYHFSIPLVVKPDRSRCAVCNNIIRIIPREKVESRVPRSVFERNESFWMCEGCGKTYWKGGHWLSIDKVLREAKPIFGNSKGL